MVDATYRAFLNYSILSDAESEKLFFSTLPYIYVGLVAIIATVLMILVSSTISRQNQRKQDTVKTMLDSRLSKQYHDLTEVARAYHLKIDDDTKQTYEQYSKGLKSSGKMREGARAVQQVLNYFEFLSVGVPQRNFDEAMVKEIIRGILCGRVHTNRWIIQERRKRKSLAYINLVAVYYRWHKSKMDKEMPPTFYLGPCPPVCLLKIHGWFMTRPWYC